MTLPKDDFDNNQQPLALPDPVLVRGGSVGRDIKDFLLNYPHEKDDVKITVNATFYANKLKFRPYGLQIDEFHVVAKGKYKLLERHHGYIQWLFPIREQGLNDLAFPLQPHEAQTIRTTPEMQTRLFTSLKLMLDFYGMAVDSTNLLVITRHPNPEICANQFENLNESYHNYLRITRIFKALVELGKQDYVPSILLFILSEQSSHGELKSRELKASMDRYWVYCMRDRDAQSCIATATKWVRDNGGKFTNEMYRQIVMGKQKDGVWKFDPPKVEVEDGMMRKMVRRCSWRHKD